ncbi:MAG: undecaprenyl-phosphate glucose phosphotransferase [Bacteroidota bacterium]|nr:undecaprenyl-phosphate glucose phosphotransferase [Bacteroidota bacterium]
MSKRYSKYLSIFHLAGDILFLNISFLISFWLKFSSFTELFLQDYINLLIFFNVAWIVLILLLKPYSIARTSRISEILRRHLTLVILHLLLAAVYFVALENYSYSREHVLITYGIYIVLLLGWKVFFTSLLRIYRKKGFNYRKVVIVGYGELSEELRKYFRVHPEHGYRLLGFFDNKHTGPNILGNFKSLKEYALQNEIDEMYCCLPYVRYTQVKEFIDFGEENLIKVKLIADFRGFSMKSLNFERYDHIPVLHVSNIPLDEAKNRVVKRSFDILFSSFVILFFLSWLMPLIALIIKLDSKGPIFFKQKRTGKDNKAFYCWKFRSMYINGDSDNVQAHKSDDRITPIGAFLRQTSLDELPQFFNVLLGNMSVVGPRPHMLKHTEEYSKLVEKFMARHFVKPGITGLAQAKGFRGETKNVELMKSRVRLDRFYVQNWSLNFDLKIIILTIYSIIKGDQNAY